MNRPALLDLCPEHRDGFLIVLVLVMGDGQLFLKFRRPVGDYLQVLLQESLFLGRLLAGQEEIISFPRHFFERDSKLRDDGGQHVRVERLSLEKSSIGGWGVREGFSVQLVLEFEAQVY